LKVSFILQLTELRLEYSLEILKSQRCSGWAPACSLRIVGSNCHRLAQFGLIRSDVPKRIGESLRKDFVSHLPISPAF